MKFKHIFTCSTVEHLDAFTIFLAILNYAITPAKLLFSIRVLNEMWIVFTPVFL